MRRLLSRLFHARRRQRPPLLLFDYDGVIADSFAVYYREFTQICSELGYHQLNSQEQFLKLFDANLVAQLMKAGFPLGKLKKLARQFTPRLQQANQQIQPFPEMPSVLEFLSQNFPLMVITANHADTVHEFLSLHKLDNIQQVIGSETETSKVKKIRRARRQFPWCQAYYVGDTKGDIIEAKRAGAVPVAAAWGWHSPERLRQANPSYLITKPDELRTLWNNKNNSNFYCE